MTNPSVHSTLIAARDWLDSHDWIQGDVIRQNLYGEPVAACLIGGLDLAAKRLDGHYWDAYNVVFDLVGGHGGVGKWNDAPGRTKAEVLALLDRAIEATA